MYLNLCQVPRLKFHWQSTDSELDSACHGRPDRRSHESFRSTVPPTSDSEARSTTHLANR